MRFITGHQLCNIDTTPNTGMVSQVEAADIFPSSFLAVFSPVLLLAWVCVTTGSMRQPGPYRGCSGSSSRMNASIKPANLLANDRHAYKHVGSLQTTDYYFELLEWNVGKMKFFGGVPLYWALCSLIFFFLNQIIMWQTFIPNTSPRPYQYRYPAFLWNV